MRFFLILPCVLFVLVRGDEEAAKETHLDELVPSRVLDKLGDGWKRSLAVLQVKDVLALPNIYSANIDITSRKSVENAISSVSPNLAKVLEGTVQALKDKHDENMSKLSQETKNFGTKVLNASKSFLTNMLKLYRQQSRQVKLDIRNTYPHVDKAIQSFYKQQAENGKSNVKNNKRSNIKKNKRSNIKKNKRSKRSTNSDEDVDQVAVLLLNLFA